MEILKTKEDYEAALKRKFNKVQFIFFTKNYRQIRKEYSA
jgi:hypothetical protein